MPITQDRMIAVLVESAKLEEYIQQIIDAVDSWRTLLSASGRLTDDEGQQLIDRVRMIGKPNLERTRVEVSHFRSTQKENDRRRKNQERKRREEGVTPATVPELGVNFQLVGMQSYRPAEIKPYISDGVDPEFDALMAANAKLTPTEIYTNMKPGYVEEKLKDKFDSFGNIRAETTRFTKPPPAIAPAPPTPPDTLDEYDPTHVDEPFVPGRKA